MQPPLVIIGLDAFRPRPVPSPGVHNHKHAPALEASIEDAYTKIRASAGAKLVTGADAAPADEILLGELAPFPTNPSARPAQHSHYRGKPADLRRRSLDRHRAAAQEGMKHVWVIPVDGTEIIAEQVSHLPDEQKQQYGVLDNRSTDLSGWSTEALGEMLLNGIDLSQGVTDLELKVLTEESLSALEQEVERGERQHETECPACGHIF